jgi:hypothetical protein
LRGKESCQRIESSRRRSRTTTSSKVEQWPSSSEGGEESVQQVQFSIDGSLGKLKVDKSVLNRSYII